MDDGGYEEILALESIYEDQLEVRDCVDGGKVISTTIYPATAEDLASRYVCLDLSLILSKMYPSESPEIRFSKSRGLSDLNLNDLKHKMSAFLTERRGESILFDLLEMAKETLTFNNIPSGLCSICLSGFQNGDDFIKTDCFHYFHCYCLNNYKHYLESDNSDENENFISGTRQRNATVLETATSVPCPVCRFPVSIDFDAIRQAIPPLDNEVCTPDERMIKSYRDKYDEIYQKQIANGGLIDLEYEQNKHLLSNIQQAYRSQQASIAEEAKLEENSKTENQPQENGSASKPKKEKHCEKSDSDTKHSVSKSNERSYKRNSRKNKPRYQNHIAHNSKPGVNPKHTRWQRQDFAGPKYSNGQNDSGKDNAEVSKNVQMDKNGAPASDNNSRRNGDRDYSERPRSKYNHFSRQQFGRGRNFKGGIHTKVLGKPKADSTNNSNQIKNRNSENKPHQSPKVEDLSIKDNVLPHPASDVNADLASVAGNQYSEPKSSYTGKNDGFNQKHNRTFQHNGGYRGGRRGRPHRPRTFGRGQSNHGVEASKYQHGQSSEDCHFSNSIKYEDSNISTKPVKSNKPPNKHQHQRKLSRARTVENPNDNDRNEAP